MRGIRKEFNSEVFNSNDPQCREVIINYMNKHGFNFIQHPDKYAVDLIDQTTGECIEIERRSIWKDGTFPYSTIHIPCRKERILGDDNIHYVIVNSYFNQFCIILGSELKKYLNNAVEISNTAVASGEYFFDVPREAFKFIKI
jgi:hypothetical protein